jgi:hypothetical protein
MSVDDGRRGEEIAGWGSTGRNRVRSRAEWKLIADLLGLVTTGRERNRYTSYLPLLYVRSLSRSVQPRRYHQPLRNLEDTPRHFAATSGFKLDTRFDCSGQHESDRTWGTITQDESFERNQIGLGCTGIYIILYLGSALGGFRTASLPLDWWAFTHDPIG